MVVKIIESVAFYELVDVSKLLKAIGICSRVEAKRLIRQGAVEIDGIKVSNNARIRNGSLLHVGKHIFRQLELPARRITFEKTGNQVRILDIGGLIGDLNG